MGLPLCCSAGPAGPCAHAWGLGQAAAAGRGLSFPLSCPVPYSCSAFFFFFFWLSTMQIRFSQRSAVTFSSHCLFTSPDTGAGGGAGSIPAGAAATGLPSALVSALHPHSSQAQEQETPLTSGVTAEAHVILAGTRLSISCLNDAATNIYCHKRGYSNTSN